MEFSSGGKLNMYQITGGHNIIIQEDALITPKEVASEMS